MALSGVVLLDRRAPTLPLPEALTGILDVPPTTRRDFTSADEVTALVRVYQRPGTTGPGHVSFRVLDAALKDVVAGETVLQSPQFAANGTADARYTLPLRGLSPGSYVLRVETADTGGPQGRAHYGAVEPMRQAITIVASCAALLAVPAAQQQPAPAQPPPFKTGVDALQLDVSVLDSSGGRFAA